MDKEQELYIITNVDARKLSKREQTELKAFSRAMNEKHKIDRGKSITFQSSIISRFRLVDGILIRAAIFYMTDICWKKCITGTIRTGSLEEWEKSCMQNCVERFVDANRAAKKQFE
jgi:hypothetical protein